MEAAASYTVTERSEEIANTTQLCHPEFLKSVDEDVQRLSFKCFSVYRILKYPQEHSGLTLPSSTQNLGRKKNLVQPWMEINAVTLHQLIFVIHCLLNPSASIQYRHCDK